jgi:uncharacterized membrane protein
VASRYARGVVARAWHALTAALVLAALVVQCVVAVRAPGTPPGHAVGTLAGAQLAGRLLRVASFFTIQSNVLVAVTSGLLAADPGRDGRVWRVLRVDALVGITVTGIVYSTVLARVHEPEGWEQTTTNAAFHYIVPVLAVVGWLLVGPRPRIDRMTIGWSLLWPALWFGYTLLHGALSAWYPYPFVSVAENGYGRVLLNALAVTAVLGGAATAFALGDAKLQPAPRPVAVAGEVGVD